MSLFPKDSGVARVHCLHCRVVMRRMPLENMPVVRKPLKISLLESQKELDLASSPSGFSHSVCNGWRLDCQKICEAMNLWRCVSWASVRNKRQQRAFAGGCEAFSLTTNDRANLKTWPTRQPSKLHWSRNESSVHNDKLHIGRRF